MKILSPALPTAPTGSNASRPPNNLIPGRPVQLPGANNIVEFRPPPGLPEPIRPPGMPATPNYPSIPQTTNWKDDPFNLNQPRPNPFYPLFGPPVFLPSESLFRPYDGRPIAIPGGVPNPQGFSIGLRYFTIVSQQSGQPSKISNPILLQAPVNSYIVPNEAGQTHSNGVIVGSFDWKDAAGRIGGLYKSVTIGVNDLDYPTVQTSNTPSNNAPNPAFTPSNAAPTVAPPPTVPNTPPAPAPNPVPPDAVPNIVPFPRRKTPETPPAPQPPREPEPKPADPPYPDPLPADPDLPPSDPEAPPEPEPEEEPEPEPEPQPKPTPTPNPTPAPDKAPPPQESPPVEPQPRVPAPAPVPVPVPAPNFLPPLVPAPIPTPTPTPVPANVPRPTPTPDTPTYPSPARPPTPAQPQPEPEPKPVPDPGIPETPARPQPQPQPDPVRPQPQPQPQPDPGEGDIQEWTPENDPEVLPGATPFPGGGLPLTIPPAPSPVAPVAPLPVPSAPGYTPTTFSPLPISPAAPPVAVAPITPVGTSPSVPIVPQVVPQIPPAAKPIYQPINTPGTIAPVTPVTPDPAPLDPCKKEGADPCQGQVSDIVKNNSNKIDKLDANTIANTAAIAGTIAALTATPISIKKYDKCEDGKAVFTSEIITVPAVLATAALKNFERLADIEAQICKKKEEDKELECFATVPEWWQLPLENYKPQLIIIYRVLLDDGTWSGTQYSITIPNPSEDYKERPKTKPSFPSYKKGNYQAILRLKDNSKLIINCKNTEEINRLMPNLVSTIDPTKLTGRPHKIVMHPDGTFNEANVKAWRVDYYPAGRGGTSPKGIKPSWTWRL